MFDESSISCFQRSSCSQVKLLPFQMLQSSGVTMATMKGFPEDVTLMSQGALRDPRGLSSISPQTFLNKHLETLPVLLCKGHVTSPGQVTRTVS